MCRLRLRHYISMAILRCFVKFIIFIGQIVTFCCWTQGPFQKPVAQISLTYMRRQVRLVAQYGADLLVGDSSRLPMLFRDFRCCSASAKARNRCLYLRQQVSRHAELGAKTGQEILFLHIRGLGNQARRRDDLRGQLRIS